MSIARLRALARRLTFRGEPRPYPVHRYIYNFQPSQLCFLCACLEETRNLPGSLAEVGCAHGYTAVFLNKYMDDREIEKRYFAVDTFGGFVAEDVQFEVERRGKAPGLIAGFEDNRQEWFDEAMRANGIRRVQSIRADVNELDLATLGPLAFCLLDVDLYRPMTKALRELYAVLSPGGILVVDDCDPKNVRWDGADQAYREFTERERLPYQVVHRKLGVVRKPA
jgi:SAM-dependent methyltransferase